jgi:hypothetical protein
MMNDGSTDGSREILQVQRPRGSAVRGLMPAFWVHNPACAQVQNEHVGGRTYYIYGTFTQLDSLPRGVNLTDPKTLDPSLGRVVHAGLRVTF